MPTCTTYVGISRLADDRHWVSDVAGGAAEEILVRWVAWPGRNSGGSAMLVPWEPE